MTVGDFLEICSKEDGVSIALVVVAVFLIAWLISFIPVFAGLKYIFD